MSRRQECRSVLTALMLLVAVCARAQEDGARDLIRAVRQAAPAITFAAKMTLACDRGTRELEVSHKSLPDGTQVSYMEVTAPIELKDTRFLVFDHVAGPDEQFIYVPSVKRAVKLGDQSRKQPFLGSEFAAGDWVQPDLDSYSYRTVGQEEIGKRHCQMIEAVPKTPADEPYGKILIAIDPVDHLVLRRQFFDASGVLLKVWTVEKLERIDGVWTVLEQLMTNVQEHHWSRILLSDLHYNAKVADEVFSQAYLNR